MTCFGMDGSTTSTLSQVPHLGYIQHREANGVHDYIKERTIRIGKHVVETRKTVRMIAKEFGVSKSTVHKDLTERLPKINPDLAAKVKEILEYHKSIRHLRGGEATGRKYQMKSQRDPMMEQMKEDQCPGTIPHR